MRLSALAIVLAALFAPPAHAGVEGDSYESDDWRIELKVPTSWRATEQTAYPNILLRLVRHGPDAHMLLTAEELEEGVSASEYAEREAAKLEEIGFEVRAPQIHSATGAYLIDFQNERAHLRQALLVAHGAGYSLTLAAGDLRTRGQLLRAFDATLRSIRIRRPEDGGAGS